MKCNNAQSSPIVFWIGVPVKSKRLRALKESSVVHLWELIFLIAWASSNIMYCHFRRWKTLLSETTKLYEVTTTWKCECYLPKFFWLKYLRMVFLWWAYPQYGSTLRLGQNFLSSYYQLWSVDEGAITRKGPQTFLWWLIRANKAMA